MRRLLEFVERAGRSRAAVRITGETGAGKELIARAIHQYSRRACRPWIDLNCAALPELLIEGELFGYERGAFSGAMSPKPSCACWRTSPDNSSASPKFWAFLCELWDGS